MKITNKCKLEPIVFNPTCLNNILYWAYNLMINNNTRSLNTEVGQEIISTLTHKNIEFDILGNTFQ